MGNNNLSRTILALLAWTIAWTGMVGLESRLDLANLSMLLVLASALSALWLPSWASLAASAVAVMAFNWFFVPPRLTFSVDLRQNALLLVALLLVNWIIAGLVIRQRRLAEAARTVAAREARLRQWGDILRDAGDPAAHAAALRTALQEATGSAVAVSVLRALGSPPDDAAALQVGEPDDEQRAGLALCVRDGRAIGAGSGRYDGLPDAYLPLRGRGVTLGAALITGLARHPQGHELRPHLQALCDQMGSALHRSLMAAQEQQARDQAQLQATRNALLAAISHDYRTPLASIMSAASALQEQGERMDNAQRQLLAAGIVEESERLAQLTDNTLQLARLDTPAVQLRCDWESAEEIVGAVLRRARRRPEGARVRARVEPDLPLLWCDATLVSQLLDNLLDNGLKYSPADTPVELHAARDGERAVLAVSDQGPGIAPAWREKVFEVFQRGEMGAAGPHADAGRGAGVGLAVCRAIARAHQGELLLRPGAEGGCRFECRLPLHGESPPPQSAPTPQETQP
ncbi:sensor histidine kinase [Acidovorax soli]|uniref:histidine kinase n=1 Tax=Acidovorax soli TaxID=592050 RepID=A0A1H4CC69_9BURK|nr:ATP-binding protein [Acidovorax soli]SEA58055.1 two-component system, OmpR family, sensor histidine kinase KdpD [Acidovorax soli]